MLSIAKGIFPLLRHESRLLFKRYTIPQVAINVRNKQSTVSSKNKHITQDDCEDDQPLNYSQSKAAILRTRHYRDADDDFPWYQAPIMVLSMSVFLIYFCILREENDIDSMLDGSLGIHFNEFEQTLAERKNVSKALK